ncbi:hypothetical protein OG625_00255 [Streptomyces sp. NBC_01351]|uniref:hypothetical protein n=1 Tax=Streptomyces sp. NBC_01351 TaxID=2903833 RepID=UPI002E35760F|nr:hypothetical protein [Streptomyces sp. NBC_01351]
MGHFPRLWTHDVVDCINDSLRNHPDTFIFMNSGAGMDVLSVYRDGPLSRIYRKPDIQLLPSYGPLIELRAPHSAAEELQGIAMGEMVAFPAPPDLPGTVRALGARQAALVGDHAHVDAFTAHELALRTGPHWREAVSTALLGEWAAPLHRGEMLHPSSLSQLAAEARAIHRQLTPLWRRKAGHGRVLLLDTPLGHGATLYDLVAGRPDPESTLLGTDDPRLRAVLNALTPAERKVALAWAHWQVTTWTEAAALAGAADPAALGERVRRKLKRQGTEHTRRRTALWTTGSEGSTS